MCNIYNAECSTCKKVIEMHLGDYQTKPSEVEVFCNEHIPEKDIVIWQGKDYWYSVTRQDHLICGNPITVGVRSLTENAGDNKKMNHPNLECDIIEER